LDGLDEGADFDYDSAGGFAIEAVCFRAAAIDDFGSWRVEAGFVQTHVVISDILFGVEYEAYVEDGWVGDVGYVLVVHQDEDETMCWIMGPTGTGLLGVCENNELRSVEFTSAALMNDAESESDLKEPGELRDVVVGKIDVIESCHGCDLLRLKAIAWAGAKMAYSATHATEKQCARTAAIAVGHTRCIRVDRVRGINASTYESAVCRAYQSG